MTFLMTMVSTAVKNITSGQKYTVIDTAGIRKRKNVRESVEKFSIVKTLKAVSED